MPWTPMPWTPMPWTPMPCGMASNATSESLEGFRLEHRLAGPPKKGLPLIFFLTMGSCSWHFGWASIPEAD